MPILRLFRCFFASIVIDVLNSMSLAEYGSVFTTRGCLVVRRSFFFAARDGGGVIIGCRPLRRWRWQRRRRRAKYRHDPLLNRERVAQTEFEDAVFHRAQSHVLGAQPSRYWHHAFKLARLIFELPKNLQPFSLGIQLDRNIRTRSPPRQVSAFLALRRRRSASWQEATLTSTFGKVIFGTTTRKTPSHIKPMAFSMSTSPFFSA